MKEHSAYIQGNFPIFRLNTTEHFTIKKPQHTSIDICELCKSHLISGFWDSQMVKCSVRSQEGVPIAYRIKEEREGGGSQPFSGDIITE